MDGIPTRSGDKGGSARSPGESVLRAVLRSLFCGSVLKRVLVWSCTLL